MEALNISQLPRWKQDEIIINGLTRQNEMLRKDLERQAKAHTEELQELENENEHLKEHNANLEGQIRRLKFRVNKLTTRKTSLKTGLAAMTAQRDMLQAQKEALREELLDTRMERDGYLNDRSIMFTVLASVRQMRNRLLEAHSNTESSLTKDAVELKRVVEGTIEDIADLHTEVERKKALSVHNEKTADEYRERLSENVRGVIQSVLDFNSGQTALHSELCDMVMAMKDQNQKDAGNNKHGLSTLSTKTGEVLDSIATHARETEQALIQRISERKSDADKYRSTVAVAVGKFRTAVTGQLDTLRTHASSLEDNMGSWAVKIKSRLDDRTTEVKSFTESVTAGLAGMQANVDSATKQQLELLGAHSEKLTSHLESEKAKMAEESNKLIKEVQSYVNRMVSDFSTRATRRTETAVAEFKSDTEVLESKTATFKAEQTVMNTTMAAQTKAWDTASTASLNDGRTTNESMHQTSKGINATVVEMSRKGEADMNTGADATDALAGSFLADTEASCAKTRTFVEKKRGEVESKTDTSKTTLAGDTEGIKVAVKEQSEVYVKSSEGVKGKLKTTVDEVHTTSEKLNDDLHDTEADGNNYVSQEIKRDAIAPPPHKAYEYPVDYSKTDPYAKILADLPSDWSRESKIREGSLQAGKGPDYPGDDGAEDSSGLYTETKHRDPAAEEAARLQDAARESDDEEYEGEVNVEDVPPSPMGEKPGSLASSPAAAPAPAPAAE